MIKRDVVVVGASAGGVEALTRFCSLLPKDFSAAVLITLHVAPDTESRLSHILQRAGQLPVSHAQNGDSLHKGRIYIAPPNHHLYIKDHTLFLSTGPRVNGARPAIDVLFQSAAHVYGPRVIGVILSGMLGDGANGLVSIKAAGGLTLVQDPEEAAFASMPQHGNSRSSQSIGMMPIDDLVKKIIQELTRQVRWK
jgi:two-component system, chemotaxis family, protein-glutamate methylesterase/glutaminase